MEDKTGRKPSSIFDKLAVQVAYSIEGQACVREIDSLVRLAKIQGGLCRFVIVTKQEAETIEVDGIEIEVVPAWKFLLEGAR